MEYTDHQFAEAWTNAFKAWEQAGRGWNVWDVAVELEPHFKKIVAHVPAQPQIVDDARTSGGIRGLVNRNNVPRLVTPFGASLTAARSVARGPAAYYRTDPIAELHLQLPRELDIHASIAEQLLLSLGHFTEPISFEIYGDRDTTSIQLACSSSFATHLATQWKTMLPSVTVARRDGFLKTQFEKNLPTVIADFGLSSSFLLPLREFRSFSPDPLNGLISSFVPVTSNERAAFQVLYVPARSPWSDVIQTVLSDAEQRKMLNQVHQSYSASAKEKFATPLFAVSIRIIVQSPTAERSWALLRQIGGGLRQFSNPRSNELIALSSEGYNENNHRLSFFSRTNYRSGFLLNTAELASLVHLPSSSVKTEKFARVASKTKPIPKLVSGNGVIVGENVHDGVTRQAKLTDEQRTRHLHIIGSTGSGKSTLLLNLIKQDIDAGKGLCVLDPAGDLVDAVCANIPDTRLDDVMLFDPSDTEFPIGFNVLQAHSDLEKTLIASDLVAAFRRMATSWGDLMDATLANGVLAILESDRGGTLIDLKRFLVEKQFRDEFLSTVKDESVRYFWINEFPLVSGKPQASILIRLDAFLRQKLIRNIVCQKENKLDFRSMMDNRKILLFKLAQGMIGLENATLLGTLIVTKLHQNALSRQETSHRPFFAIYLDEFHNFVGPSIEPILSGIRKFNVGLTLSHQEFRQLQSRSQEVAASVLSNCYTRICFRLGDADADRFSGGFSYFDSADLQNLGIGEAIARVEKAAHDFNLNTIDPGRIDQMNLEKKRSELVQRSRTRYALSRSSAEAEAASARKFSMTPIGVEFTQEPSPANKVRSTGRPEPQIDTTANEHQYLQKILKRIAEKYGFIATVEKPVLGGAGRIDVALENDTFKVACEVAVTNTVDYEVQSIQKCISAGYDRVIVLSINETHLRNIERVAITTVDPGHIENVAFLKPDNFHLYLERLCAQPQEQSSDVKVKGYKILTSFADTTPSEAELIKESIVEILEMEDRR